ncbi:MAG TPA: hypothetical protein PK455_06940, partial [Caldisericia bacterium]|nr:hypothetical protein [Caldisericia bacterium]
MNLITKGDEFTLNGEVVFLVETFGVPSLVTNYAELSGGDPGGEIKVVVAPKDAVTKLKLRVYTMNAMYDYNSSIQHPPYFIYDPSPGIDYCGVKEFKVLPPDPYVNFAEFKIVDHALQNSEVNYTSGYQATSPLPYPTPQIQAPYDPIIKDVGKDFRCYPGGQTHVTRMVGIFDLNIYLAYPAIWWWYWYDNVDYNNFTDFNKLGMEFIPLTDYGIYFIPKNGEGENLSFDPETPLDRRITKITVEGPFARPQVVDYTTGKMTVELVKGSMINLPTLYDYSGKVTIDISNYKWYEYKGADWTQVIGFGPDTRYKNKRNAILGLSGDLDYTGLDNVIRIDEIIPTGAGVITITVELADGTKKIYQDCCAEPPTDGIVSHGIDISGIPDTLEIGSDHKIEAKLTELETYQKEENCNSAYTYIWQDRGLRIHIESNEITLDTQFGMCDGITEGVPLSAGAISMAGEISSGVNNAAVQFPSINDINKDGKISFNDYETEIMGTYDLATNTWVGGLVDARTFNVDSGKYIFDLSDTTGGKLVDMGADIGFIPMGGNETQENILKDADHVISKWEVCPIYITAYKYGDDNNDRAFAYSTGTQGFDILGGYSHEVYLAGQARIMPTPIQDLAVSVQPSVLTAGCVPELVDPSTPLSFMVTDSNGRAVDLTKGVDLGFLKGLPLRFRAEPEAIWKHLFYDPHPEPLPQYYWLRTDLHNNDDSLQCNERMFSVPARPFRPIQVDFSLASTGKYVFTGFCANDAGEFDVYVYTPD